MLVFIVVARLLIFKATTELEEDYESRSSLSATNALFFLRTSHFFWNMSFPSCGKPLGDFQCSGNVIFDKFSHCFYGDDFSEVLFLQPWTSPCGALKEYSNPLGALLDGISCEQNQVSYSRLCNSFASQEVEPEMRIPVQKILLKKDSLEKSLSMPGRVKKPKAECDFRQNPSFSLIVPRISRVYVMSHCLYVLKPREVIIWAELFHSKNSYVEVLTSQYLRK